MKFLKRIMKQKEILANNNFYTKPAKKKQMQDSRNQIETLFEKAVDYLETRLDLVKLKTTEKSSDVISSLVSNLILIIFLCLVLIMINIGVALFLGDLLGKNYYGFFVLAGFYILTGIVFYLFKDKWIKAPLSNTIIKKMSN